MKSILLRMMFPAMYGILLCAAGNFLYGQTRPKPKMEKIRLAKVAHVDFECANPCFREIENKFETIASNAVDVVNWPDRNGDYSPKASFKIMYSDTYLYIRYQVEETELRATFPADSGARPWTDDCMELFILPDEETGVYYNIEMNCIGRGIVGYGPFKQGREHFEKERMDRILRYSSLGTEAFGTRIASDSEPFKWSMIIAVPLDLILQGKDVSKLRGRTARGNVFKCGDDMQHRHYLTWNPVGTERPDYHRPEFFGYFEFE